MRAYYVTARRSEGIPDAVIAAEIGDRTGAKIIVDFYGDLPPDWLDAKEGKIGFLPVGNDENTGLPKQPAWAALELEKMIPLPLADAI